MVDKAALSLETLTIPDRAWLTVSSRQVELAVQASDENAAHLLGFNVGSIAAVTESAGRIVAVGAAILSKMPVLKLLAAGVMF